MLCILILHFLLLSFYQPCITIKVDKRHNYQYYSPVIYKHKWITSETRFPLRLETPVRIDADFKWFKNLENLYIEEIDGFENNYKFIQDDSKLILDILNYDHYTHHQLSSYEPKIVGTRTESIQEKEIFSLFYLKSFLIEIKKLQRKNMAFCNVTILIPNDNNLIQSKNKAKVLQNIILKFGTRLKRDIHNINSSDKNNIRTKRHDKNFVALEIVEGPIYFGNFFFAKQETVKCNLQLWDNNRIAFHQTISKNIDSINNFRNLALLNRFKCKFLFLFIHFVLL